MAEIKQIVPPEWCFKCDVCCRFPESTSFLAPYFTGQEIDAAVQSGAAEPDFLNKTGCKITLMPYEEAYICPSFDTTTTHCRIYKARPFDCVLYPFALMLDETGEKVVLGLDTKCPYVRENTGTDYIRDACMDIAYTIDSPPFADIISENLDLIGPFQDDVVPLIVLNNLSSRL